MNTTFLLVAVCLVMLAGLVGTFAVGLSAKNKSENAAYSSGMGKKWSRLGALYIVVTIIIVAIFIAWVNG